MSLSRTFLATMVAAMDANPSVGIACSDCFKIDEAGTVVGPVERTLPGDSGARWSQSFLASGQEEVRGSLYIQNTIVSASSVVFRREIYRKAGEADPRMSIAGDWLQWCKLLLLSDFCYVAEPLCKTRIHASTQRAHSSSNGQYELEGLVVQRRIRERISVERVVIQKGADRFSRSWLQSVRAGRYRGSMMQHLHFMRELFRADVTIGTHFSLSIPYALMIWLLKNTVFRGRRDVA